MGGVTGLGAEKTAASGTFLVRPLSLSRAANRRRKLRMKLRKWLSLLLALAVLTGAAGAAAAQDALAEAAR